MVIDIQQEGGETESASGQTDRNLPYSLQVIPALPVMNIEHKTNNRLEGHTWFIKLTSVRIVNDSFSFPLPLPTPSSYQPLPPPPLDLSWQ